MKGPSSRIDPTPYRRPRPIAPHTLRLDGNEGLRPSRLLLIDLASRSSEVLRNYPDAGLLEEKLAQVLGVAAERVVVTTGADDALDRCCRAYLEAGSQLILPTPAFEMLFRFAGNAGGEVIEVPWTSSFPVDEVIARIGPQTTLIAIVSPNNPTGAVATLDDLRRVADAAVGRALVILDQVYREYADYDLTEAALALENVVLVRSFSKAWGLAGCRIGYAVAPPSIAAVLRSAGNPYPISGLSLAVAARHLEQRDDGGLEDHVAQVRTEREELTRKLASLEVVVPRSQANFVLADFGSRVGFVFEALRACGVLVRWFPNRQGLETRLRITLPGDPDDFRRLVKALELCLDPQALLFDLDGVLADVSESYDGCILATALEFGCELEAKKIEQARLEGDSNNDWLLTQRLLRRWGREVELQEVTRRFQRHYRGDGDRPGLRDRERPLLRVAALAAWAERLPLGVVTGRPRQEAEWFLERWGLRALMGALVTAEDGPRKPDPTPVRLALQQLGVERAWMVGDTPDDIRAASAAGVLALAVAAPGADPEQAAGALRRAGAAAVLERLEALEDHLP